MVTRSHLSRFQHSEMNKAILLEDARSNLDNERVKVSRSEVQQQERF
jgi:hypothetical protein